MSLWDIFKHWTKNKVLQVLPRFLLLSRFPIFVTYHWEKHGSVGAPVGMLNHSHLLRPPHPPPPLHARYPESSVLCWEHGTVHARLISPRPSCPSMPAVSEEVDGSQGSGSPPSSLPHPGPIAHLSLKRKTMLGVAENGNSLRRSCEFGSDLLWPPPLESEGQYTDAAHTHTLTS